MGRRHSTHPEYKTWDIDHDEHEHAEFVGTMGEGEPVFYNPAKETTFKGAPHAEDQRVTPVEGSEQRLEPGESIGQAIERLGEKTGWDSLSEFARKHLKSNEGTDGNDESDG